MTSSDRVTSPTADLKIENDRKRQLVPRWSKWLLRTTWDTKWTREGVSQDEMLKGQAYCLPDIGTRDLPGWKWSLAASTMGGQSALPYDRMRRRRLEMGWPYLRITAYW
jgi:hypothetical protein